METFLYFLLLLISTTLCSLLVCFFLFQLVPFLFKVVVYFTLFLCKFVHENMLVVNLKALFYQQRYGKRLIIISINIMVFPDFVFKPCVCSYGCLFCWKNKLLSWIELGEVCYRWLLWQAWSFFCQICGLVLS